MFYKKMKEKKGTLTTKMLVTLILLIVSFVIIFYFLVMFDWTGRIDKEVCHQSVIYRATLPSFAGLKGYVPLKCKTNKICITSGLVGGDCEEFENLKGINKMKVKNEEQIEQILAREIVDCWRTMGEGKVQVFSQWMADTYGIGKVGSSCVICNRVAFDKESLQKADIDLDKVDVMNYMMTHAVPNQNISYYGYLSGKGGKISVKDDFRVVDIEEIQGFEFENGKLKLDLGSKDFSEEESDEWAELSIMFMQITAPTHTKVISNTLKTAGIGMGLAFLSSPKISAKAVGIAVSGGWITVAIGAVLGIYQHGSVARNKAITAGYCSDISTGDDAREGCSVVRTVNYNLEDISRYCSIIESIP